MNSTSLVSPDIVMHAVVEDLLDDSTVFDICVKEYDLLSSWCSPVQPTRATVPWIQTIWARAVRS